ncbi:MAG: deoxyribodipyrimidine photo-lyase [Porticoccaceae bacterium]|jgi:deoxyribodipyrimidine photo-lyase
MENSKVTLFWFRRDLRIEDNTAFFNALNSKNNVLPIFIFDTEIIDELEKDDSRITFIYSLLKGINDTLKKSNASLLIEKGNPIEVFAKLIKNYSIESVYTNRDYEPYASIRDKEIEGLLKNNAIEFNTYKDHVVFETNEIVKQDATPYKVYTPYSKKWLSTLHNSHLKEYQSENLLHKLFKSNFTFPSMDTIGFSESKIKVVPFNTTDSLIENYNATRNFPAINKTSKLSPHLRFGSISIRKCVQMALKSSDPTFVKELIWREFFIQILWHFPKSAQFNFKPKYNSIKWRNNESEFNAWCNGKTGYPIVDAGMNELNKTGYMHNRVRMITASFLCKHLLIDWKWGEAYFAKKLLDFDLAQNVGNWQWTAGTGCDSAPYFRIFNPTEQVKKFDKDLEYIKQWVPDFQELTYPSPIVEHKYARIRCLETYKSGLNG